MSNKPNLKSIEATALNGMVVLTMVGGLICFVLTLQALGMLWDLWTLSLITMPAAMAMLLLFLLAIGLSLWVVVLLARCGHEWLQARKANAKPKHD